MLQSDRLRQAVGQWPPSADGFPTSPGVEGSHIEAKYDPPQTFCRAGRTFYQSRNSAPNGPAFTEPLRSAGSGLDWAWLISEYPFAWAADELLRLRKWPSFRHWLPMI